MWGIYKIALNVTLFTCISIGICALTPEEEILTFAGQNDLNSVSDSANNRLASPPNNEEPSHVIDLSKVFDNIEVTTRITLD